MKKLFIIYLTSYILHLTSFSQPIQNFVDYYDKEQKQKRSEGKFVNGFEEGEWKFWYPCLGCKAGETGKIKEISNYQNGKLHGKVSIYYGNGSKQNEGFFKRNLPDSIYSEWYPCARCKEGEGGNLKVTGFYDEKIKNGMWIFYYPDGKKIKEEYFFNGHPKLANSWDTSGTSLVINGKGKHIEYFEGTNKKKEVCEYADSIPSGNFTAWYRNSKIKEEGKYLDGKPHGIWKFFHSNGKPNKKATYNNGELDGEFTQYFSNGKTEASGNYVKGKKHGYWVMFRENNNKDFEGEFKEDLQHGNWIYYYSSGEKESFGLFNAGKRDSTWVFLYKTGEKWKEGVYREDLKNGKWITLFENGKKLQEGNYLNGKEDGLWTSWYGEEEKNSRQLTIDSQQTEQKQEERQKKDEGYYKNGLMEGAWSGWYPNGNKNYEGKIQDGLKEGEWTFWFVDGKMREKGSYSKGKKQGYWEFYHELGGKESEGNLVDEKHDGKWMYYYACPECKAGENGQKMREESMKKGALHGKATVWYPGGTIQSETNFKNGNPDGEWKQYNKNGILTMDRVYKDGNLVKDKKN